MKQTETIECPYCGQLQADFITDYIDAGDMDGEFTAECDLCQQAFTIEFEFRSFVETSKTP